MQLNWLQSLLYGLVSGFADFLPVSSRAHQDILLSLFGCIEHDPVRDFLVRISLLFVLVSSCRDLLSQFQRENRSAYRNVRTRRSVQSTFVAQLIKSATLPMIIGMIIISYIYKGGLNLLTVALFLLINGVILYIPSRMLQGNKDASSLSVLDGWLLGIGAALSIISGVSRVAGVTSAGMIRGADRKKTLNWALILSVPALVTLSCLDLVSIFFNASQIPFWSNLGGYVLTIIGAIIGSYISIILIRFITKRANYIGFAYYSWGLGLFAFIMYLIIV